MLRAVCSLMRSTASTVTPATCGAMMTFGSANNAWPAGGGSCSKTSSPAPASLPDEQRCVQRGLVDDAAARRVDQERLRLHALQPVGIEHADRLRRLRAMDADEVGARQRGVEIGDRLAAGGLDVGGGLVGIEHQHVHFHRQAALGGAAADAAEADDQDRLAVEIERQHAEPLRPSVVPDQRMHFGRALGERQHHEQRAFGDRGRIGRACDHQRDLAAAERRDVDGVEADADPGHDEHVLRGLELGIAEAGAAERDAMHRRMLLQLGVEIRLRDHVGKFDEIDVVPRVEQRSSLLRHRFRDEDFLLVGSHFLPLGLAIAPSKDDAGHLV